MIYRADGKKWTLPDKLKFSYGLTTDAYKVVGYRKPLKGEYFLSGDPVGVYKTYNDLDTVYLIAEKENS